MLSAKQQEHDLLLDQQKIDLKMINTVCNRIIQQCALINELHRIKATKRAGTRVR